MLKDAWTLAIETLSQIELQKLSERMALARITKRLGIRSPNTLRYAYGLVVETVRRRNLIDKLIDSVLQPKTVGELNLGVRAFLRLYVYQTRVVTDWAEADVEEASRIAKLGRSIIGWKTMRVVETALGLLLTREIAPIVKKTTDEEKVALCTFHPTWFVS